MINIFSALRQNNKVHTTKNKINYHLTAGYWRGHHVHSPFSYDLIRHVITTRKRDLSLRDKMREYRNALLSSKESVFVEDFGTGTSNVRQISEIARRTATHEKYGLVLARMAKHFKPETIIEIGTSLGVGTAYMAAASPESKIYTIEGSSEIAKQAEQNFKAFGLENIEVTCNNFDTALPELLEQHGAQFVFIDGNHTCEATLRYFEMCCAKAQHGTILVFDDIYWSQGMTEAWRTICADPRVQVTIDIFQLGIACFRNGCPKQHYKLRF